MRAAGTRAMFARVLRRCLQVDPPTRGAGVARDGCQGVPHVFHLPGRFAGLLVVAALAQTPARGQAILSEAYLDAAEAAAAEQDVPKAARLFALALGEARDGSNPTLTARALLGAANVHVQMSQFAKARANVKAALAIYERQKEVDRMAVLAGVSTMAAVQYFQKQYEEAEALYAKLILGLKEEDEEDGVLVGFALNDMARVQIALKQPEKAEALATAAADIMKDKFGPDCANVALCVDTLAQALHAEGKHEDAEKVATKAMDICKAELGPEHAQVGSHLHTLGRIQQSRGNHQEGLKSLERSLAIQQRERGKNHPLVAEVREASSRLRAHLTQRGQEGPKPTADQPPGDRVPSQVPPGSARDK